MSPIKSFLGSETVRQTLCWLGAHYIRFVRMTASWRVIGGDIPERFLATGKPFILAFWHGRLLMMPCCWTSDKTIHILMQGAPEDISIEEVIDAMEHVAGVSSVHHLHLWQLDEHKNALEAHVVIKDFSETEKIKIAVNE